MKNILKILFCFLTLYNLNAQNPDFEGTWVLDFVFTNGIITSVPSNAEIDEVVLVTTFNNIRTRVCDAIESPIVSIDDNSFTTVEFIKELNGCTLPETLDFQDIYFGGFFKLATPDLPYLYFLDEDGNGNKTLILENINQERAHFKQATLSNEDFNNQSITIYPNPVNEWLHVTLKEPLQHIIIYDMLGREVLVSKFRQTNPIIDTSKLQTGVYFLKAESNTGQLRTVKFVKK